MGILDDAIRQHLDLKRKHGARDSELREIEDDAFASGERPDPFAAGDLFSDSPESGGAAPQAERTPGPETPPPPGLSGGDEEPTRLVEPSASSAPAAPPAEDAPVRPEAPESPEPPAPPSAPPTDVREPLAPPDAPAAPERSVPERPADSGRPPESESLAELMAEEEALEATAPPTPAPPAPPPETAPPARPEPLEEEEPVADLPGDDQLAGEQPPVQDSADGALLEEELDDEPEPHESEPASSSPDPPPPPPPPEPGTEPPGRARGRVHHPTEEMSAPESTVEEDEEDLGPPSAEPLEPAGASSAAAAEDTDTSEPMLYDFETDEGSITQGSVEAPAADSPVEAEPAEPPPAPAPPQDDFEDLGPAEEAGAYAGDIEEEEPYPELEQPPPPAGDEPVDELVDEPDEEPQPDEPAPAEEPAPATADGEDLLSESPEFMEGDTGEGEDLWFEKGPPKDFDFDD